MSNGTGPGGTGGTGGRATAFIGSFTSAGGRGIIAAAVDEQTGALSETAATDAVADPSYLAVGAAESGPVLYAVSETDEGAVAAFDIIATIATIATTATSATAGEGPAAFRLIGAPAPVSGAGPTHLAVAGGHLLTANYGSGSVSVLPVGPAGAPAAAVGVLRHEGSGPHPERQRGPHAHQVLPDPTGRWILGVDLGTDSVRVGELDPATGDLSPHGETPLRPGTGPRQLAFHPSGRYAYVLGELEPVLTVCRWEAEEGVLEPVGETAVLPEGLAGVSYPSAVVVAHDGRFVWVANRGHDSISVLALDPSGEKAELVTTVPCGGHWPRDLALDPTGTRLYAANERSGDVTWFDIDAASGLPRRAGSIAAPAASCVVFA
ncbi:lactonase family protein [Streptomyces sp. FIT100]|uniref:lactonase family protein n=1 Tax=Streptomyces sp. FIT100 TaxID=2837956 RepID=UPI0021CA1C28|nr:lactonase family protein [Streptomyces sp. FIT100]UUN25371.1 beta-propeller fold lactonase family protein [Streptomyces sp. FIT100]